MKLRKRPERRKKSAKDLQKRSEKLKRLNRKDSVLKPKLQLPKLREFVSRKKQPKRLGKKRKRDYASRKKKDSARKRQKKND